MPSIREGWTSRSVSVVRSENGLAGSQHRHNCDAFSDLCHGGYLPLAMPSQVASSIRSNGLRAYAEAAKPMPEGDFLSKAKRRGTTILDRQAINSYEMHLYETSGSGHVTREVERRQPRDNMTISSAVSRVPMRSECMVS